MNEMMSVIVTVELVKNESLLTGAIANGLTLIHKHFASISLESSPHN